MIEISLLIIGTAAVTFFNELYVFAGVISMFFCCNGWHQQEKKQYVYDSFYAGLSAALGVLIFFTLFSGSCSILLQPLRLRAGRFRL